ncbi:MAG: dihydroxyacetone kinase subunit DhaK [Spirochaetaceae bacterium]|nr:MAG: dihydroxyacetone kinase subunit DhaK [Spirochaetaceae bacterium]
MKKFLNRPEDFVDEMLQGILAAHPDQLKYVADDLRCIVRADAPVSSKVGLATGGGSGHLPLFLGYVGKGMLDGCAVGGVFQSPSSEQMLEVTKAINGGKGVLYIYGNYSGDIINFDMAAEMAELEDISVASYVAGEDVASAPKGEEQKRRGVAGIFYVYKCAGAKADEGADLAEVKRIAEKAGASVRTMGVALSPVIVPEVGKPSFTIGEGEMEIGMGIHGEPGIRRGKLLTADEVVQEMMDKIIPDLPFGKGDEVSVLVNGLGATPREELYVAYRKVAEILGQQGISVFKTYVGEFATSLEMTGFSLSVCKLDAELKALLSKAARTPFFEQVQL